MRLKTASAKLIRLRYCNPTANGNQTNCIRYESTKKRPERTMLVSGPATAILSSTLGLVGSRESEATPPKTKRMIFLIETPLRLAMMECASSCVRTEEKNRSVVIKLTTMLVVVVKEKSAG